MKNQNKNSSCVRYQLHQSCMDTSTQDNSNEMSDEFLIKDRNDEYKTEKCSPMVQCTDDSVSADSLNPVVFSSSSHEDNLKAKLDKSIEDNNDTECEKLLKTNTITKTLPIIVPGLDRAITSGNKKIVKIINSHICSNSSKIVSNFYKQYEEILKDTSVWMGTECSCSKTDTLKYEEKICDSSKILLIVEPNDESSNVQMENFHDFPIKVKTSSSFRRNESKAVAQGIIPELHQKLDRVPKSVAKRLFKKHSNLTMVCPSAFKSIGFGLEERSVSKINCISLFCRLKGIIPIGEYHFPLKIGDVQTDVFEGTSHFTSALHIGDKIHNHQQEAGTLGGFVKYYGIDTFLTCAHVIFGKSNISNLQKRYIHFNFHTLHNDDDTRPVQCTLIRHILNYETQESEMEVDDEESADDEEETTIDAALVLIQMPNIFHDSTGGPSCVRNDVSTHAITQPTQGSIETASCANNPVELRIKLNDCVDQTGDNLPALGLRSKYLNDNFYDSDDVHSRAIALSSFSGSQERLISAIKMNRVKIPLQCHVRMDTILMYNQYSIQNMDFGEGDSGTCIYAIETGSQETGCIGMLVGKSTSGECIFTPMKEILKALEVDI
ncbi:unnamed protein product [Mytilus coruscus]|uniref:Uncharacterized protein n=1 Tax=Mytilus coruscus TaxID=42192 RepID=A0A6J8BG37_MYTCO|nr:unnamed protein product [Mytilus coruscus]